MRINTQKKFKILMDTFSHKEILEEIYLDSCVVNKDNFDIDATIDDLFEEWVIKAKLGDLQ